MINSMKSINFDVCVTDTLVCVSESDPFLRFAENSTLLQKEKLENLVFSKVSS